MSDLEARIGEALAEHRRQRGTRDLCAHCACGWVSTERGESILRHEEHQATALAQALADHTRKVKVTTLREAADEVGAWGPACIPAAQALRNRANTIDNQ